MTPYLFCRELEIEHPAAKMLVLGAQMQENEVGDATNLVIILAGMLLKEAEDLIRYVYCLMFHLV